MAEGGAAARLISVVSESLLILRSVLEHREQLGAEHAHQLEKIISDIERRRAKKELTVAVIGEFKAGKSTFLNAVLGVPLLGVGIQEFTGTITRLRHAPSLNYRAHLLPETEGQAEAVEEFISICPDRTAELLEKRQGLARTLADAVESVGSLHAQATELEQRILVLKEELADLCMLAEAEQGQRDALAQAHQAALVRRQTAQSEYEQRSLAIPSLLDRQPSWYAVWLWLAWIVLYLIHRYDYRSLRDAERRLADERQAVGLLSEQERAAFSKVQSMKLAGQDVANLENALDALMARIKDAEGEQSELHLAYEESERWPQAHAAERLERFQSRLSELSDMRRLGWRVREIEIDYPAKHLPDGIVLLDTPGVNSNHAENVHRAYSAIEHDADGCLVLMALQQAASQSTLAFIERTRSWVPHLVLIFTKKDQVVQMVQASSFGQTSDAEEQIREVVRRAKRSFGTATGRKPKQIIEYVISAEVALQQSDPTVVAEFAEQMSSLFSLLRREQILIIGARCSLMLRRTIDSIKEAVERTEASYRERLALLEAQRLPSPEAFCSLLVARCEEQADGWSEEIWKPADAEIHTYFSHICEQLVRQINGCKERSEIRSVAEQFAGNLEGMKDSFQKSFSANIAALMHAHVNANFPAFVTELRRRYQLVQEMVRNHAAPDSVASISATKLDGLSVAWTSPGRSFHLGAAAAGAGTGAILGTLVPPGIGTLIGGLLGGLAGLFERLDTCKKKYIKALEDLLAQIETQVHDWFAGQRPALRGGLVDLYKNSLETMIVAYQSWIQGVLDREQQTIQLSRGRLEQITNARSRLTQNSDRLAQAMEAAAQESLAMCRYIE